MAAVMLWYKVKIAILIGEHIGFDTEVYDFVIHVLKLC